MKKNLALAIALAVGSGAASAQSSVTIYGKIDLGLVMDSGNPAGKSVRVTSGVTGGSRLGFKGVEDLGGGNKASFQLETGFCADSAAGAPNFCTGGNQFMGRQVHGDLSGSFGLLTAGRVYSLDFLNQGTFDPFGAGFLGDSQNLFGDKFASSRLNNTIQYTTPSMGGLTASAELCLGETTGNWKAGRETGGALTYAKGPAFVSLSFFDLDNANGSGAARKNYLLGGTYDFGIIKLYGGLERATGNPTGAARPLDALDLLGGVSFPVAGGSVLASYIKHNDRTARAAPGGGDRDASQLGLGYVYPLSKLTSLYLSYARIQDLHGATFTVGSATETGTGNKGFALGAVKDF